MERFSKVLVPLSRPDGQAPAAAVNGSTGAGVQAGVDARKDGDSELTRSGESEPGPGPKVVTAQPRQRFHIYDTVGLASAPPDADSDVASARGEMANGEAGGRDANRAMWHMESVSSVASGTTEGSGGGDDNADGDADHVPTLSESTCDSIFEAQLESQLENADLVPVLRPRSSEPDAGEREQSTSNRDSQLFGSLDQQLQLQLGALDAQAQAQEMFGTLDSLDPSQSQSQERTGAAQAMLVPDPGSQFDSIDRTESVNASSLALHLPTAMADSVHTQGSAAEMLPTPLAEQRSLLDDLARPAASAALQQQQEEQQHSLSQSPAGNQDNIVTYDPAKCREKLVLVTKSPSDSLGTVIQFSCVFDT